ncbi:MAG: hypothetical protein ACFB22_10975 [Rhodothalassiaceae bacterium]
MPSIPAIRDLLALLALLTVQLMPWAAHAGADDTLRICTADGPQTVAWAGIGTGPDQPPESGPDCPDCHGCCGAQVLPERALLTRTHSAGNGVAGHAPANPDPQLAPAARPALPSRGPPSAV